jgi:K+-transporting ATPase KdpF subunit
MVTFYWIGGGVALLLFGYLVFALLKPESLS